MESKTLAPKPALGTITCKVGSLSIREQNRHLIVSRSRGVLKWLNTHLSGSCRVAKQNTQIHAQNRPMNENLWHGTAATSHCIWSCSIRFESSASLMRARWTKCWPWRPSSLRRSTLASHGLRLTPSYYRSAWFSACGRPTWTNRRLCSRSDCSSTVLVHECVV